MSSAYHPQSDGQSEVMNRVIEQYLRALVHRRSGTWGRFLPWVELSHNTSWNAGTGSTPYEITFGRKPFSFPDYITSSSKLDAVDDTLKHCEEVFLCIRQKLLKAQATMKRTADTKWREVDYEVGNWVLLKLRPYRQRSAKDAQHNSGKLAKRFYGPFKILERIGKVAYRLELPEGARIHPIFHCSLLKPFHGDLAISQTPAISPSTSTVPSMHNFYNIYLTYSAMNIHINFKKVNREMYIVIHHLILHLLHSP